MFYLAHNEGEMGSIPVPANGRRVAIRTDSDLKSETTGKPKGKSERRGATTRGAPSPALAIELDSGWSPKLSLVGSIPTVAVWRKSRVRFPPCVP